MDPRLKECMKYLQQEEKRQGGRDTLLDRETFSKFVSLYYSIKFVRLLNEVRYFNMKQLCIVSKDPTTSEIVHV